MPLDPIIANPAALKMPDPLESYNNFLLASNRQEVMNDARRKRQVNETLNALYKKHTDTNGVTNFNALRGDIAANNLGEVIPGMLKQEGERNKTTAETTKVGEETNKVKAETIKVGEETNKVKAETGKTQQEAFKIAEDNYRRRLEGISLDPVEGAKQLHAYIRGKFDDPVMGPILRAGKLTPEAAEAALDNSLKTHSIADIVSQLSMGIEKASEQHIDSQNLGTRVVSVSTPSHALPGTTPKSTVTGSNVRVPDPATSVHVTVPVTTQVSTHAGKSLMETMEEEQGKDLAALSRLNDNAPAELANVDKTLKMLQSGNVITGAFADQKAGLLSIAKSFGVPVNSDMLKNTQLLRQQIGINLMGRIAGYKAQGVSLTPMSNLDLENFQRSGPQIFDDPAALIEMFKNYRETVQQGVARYESKMGKKKKSPVVGPAINDVNQPDAPAKVPPAPVAGPPAAAIQYLRQHPETAAAFEKKYNLPPGSAKRYVGGR